jgi:hypothetical protein
MQKLNECDPKIKKRVEKIVKNSIGMKINAFEVVQTISDIQIEFAGVWECAFHYIVNDRYKVTQFTTFADDIFDCSVITEKK